MNKINGVFLLLSVSIGVPAQEHKETIRKEYTFEKQAATNTLLIANINGKIVVTGYDGDKVLIEVNKKITAKTDDRLKQGVEEIQLGEINRVDTILLFTKSGCNTFGKRKGRNPKHGWGYDWDKACSNEGYTFDYRMDYTIKVPRRLNLIVSTINNGNVDISGVSGAILADNINGSIKLVNLTRQARASTINGDVDIVYDQNPSEACRFYTLNGNINANFRKGLSANMRFESFNGDFYTNVPALENLPTTIEKESTDNGIRYKLQGNHFRIGKGGVLLDFETFNGNVYLKEI